MKGLDTNVMLRYIVKDDPHQCAEAAAYIRTHCTSSSPGFINRIVLCELVWVLETAYKFRRGEVARVVEMILSTEEFLVENPSEALSALQAYRDQGMDFSDALIGCTNRSFGCEETASFDQRAAQMTEFTLLGTARKPPQKRR